MATDRLRLAAFALAVVVAATHLYWALPQIVRQLHFGMAHDPRPAAFLLAVFAMSLGVMLAYQGFDPGPVYLGGMALMVVFLVGYGAWHTVLDHGAFWPGRHAHGHDEPALWVIVDHLLADRLALVSKLAEAALLAVLALLYVEER